MADEPTLQEGDDGEWVDYLRSLLAYATDNQNLVDDAEQTDVFDRQLEGAVRAYQDRQGLDATGVCDEETWAALKGERQSGDSDEDAPVGPDGEAGGGGAEGGGDGGILDMFGLTVVSLTFAGDPSVKPDKLKWVVMNEGTTKAPNYEIYYRVTDGDGEELFSDQDTRSNDVEPGNDFEDGLTLAEFNAYISNGMTRVREFEMYHLDVCLEPGQAWEAWGQVDFQVSLENLPEEPESEDEDDEWGDTRDLAKVAGFIPG